MRFAPVNAAVGVLFLVRAPLRRAPSWGIAAIAAPSIVISGTALKMAPAAHTWSVYAESVFVAGAVIAIVALTFLGRSFALLPGLRGEIVDRGPFRLVRHPAYFGELLMLAACALAAASWTAWLPIAAAVRWRLLPGVW